MKIKRIRIYEHLDGRYSYGLRYRFWPFWFDKPYTYPKIKDVISAIVGDLKVQRGQMKETISTFSANGAIIDQLEATLRETTETQDY